MVTLMRLGRREEQAESVDLANDKRTGSINSRPAGSVGPLGGRLPLALVVGVVIVLGVGGLGFLLLSGQSQGGGQAQLSITPVTGRHSASPSTSASVSPSSTPSVSGRDPFGGTASSPTGSAAPSAAVAPSPSGAGSASFTPSVSIGSVTTATVTRTATVTVASSAGYLGLYGWTSASLPILWVNDVTVTPAVGATFATSFVYVGQSVQGTSTCADVTYHGAATSVCLGKVVKVG